MSFPRLKVEGLTKSFFGIPVLHGIAFEASASEILGLVGENGSGKSTAMNVLAGILLPDAGRLWLEGRLYRPHSARDAQVSGVAFVQQELSIFPNLTVAENMFLGRFPRRLPGLTLLNRRRMALRASEILQTLDLHLDPNQLAESLSTGERQLVEVARALLSEAKVMIFDEPTTSLTRPETERLFSLIRRLKARGTTTVFISHALEDVVSLCDRTLVMRDGRMVGEFSQSTATPHNLVLAMVGRPIEALFPKREYSAPRAQPLLEVDRLGEPGVLNNINLRIHPGEIVGIGGLMGSGRTEIARTLFGLDTHHEGTIRMAGRLLHPGSVRERLETGIAFLTEDRRREGLLRDASVARNMALAALPRFILGAGRIDDARLGRLMQDLVHRLSLKSGPLDATPIQSLSGGNQQKVLLGRWLLLNPQLFILDEPTRGVDVGAKAEIYRILTELADNGGALLIVSSELEELIGLADRILILRKGGVQAEFARSEFDRERILAAAFGQVRAA
jgi:ribose transport system ATP-binding protein